MFTYSSQHSRHIQYTKACQRAFTFRGSDRSETSPAANWHVRLQQTASTEQRSRLPSSNCHTKAFVSCIGNNRKRKIRKTNLIVPYASPRSSPISKFRQVSVIELGKIFVESFHILARNSDQAKMFTGLVETVGSESQSALHIRKWNPINADDISPKSSPTSLPSTPPRLVGEAPLSPSRNVVPY